MFPARQSGGPIPDLDRGSQVFVRACCEVDEKLGAIDTRGVATLGW
jgi:hypothetical protein